MPVKIDDLSTLPANENLEADIIIVGAGPAGLSIARELGGSSLRVLVCESGVVGRHEDYYHLNQVEAQTGAMFDPKSPLRMEFFTNTNPVWNPDVEPFGSRIRGYGGSTAYWGGKAATFDENDFKKRDWVSHSGWPVSLTEVSEYFDRAGAIISIGPNVYDDRLWSMLGKDKPEPRLSDDNLKSTFWQFSRSSMAKTDIVRFARDHAEIPGDNLRTITNATVTRIDLSEDGTAFHGVEVSTLQGERRFIRAKTCILAASAIENPRLLLANRHQHGDGIGNRHDVVGRYLMDHPGGKVGHFPLKDVKAVSRHFGFFGLQRGRKTHMYMHGLLLSARKQKEEELLNAALFALEGVSPDDPVAAIKRLIRFRSPKPFTDMASVAGGLGVLFKGFGMKLMESGVIPARVQDAIIGVAMRLSPNMVVREYQNMGIPHKIASLDLYSLCEQRPSPESRITLGESKDHFGVPRALVQWRLSEAESGTIMRLAQITADEMEAKGLPRPVLVDWIANNRPQDAQLSDMAHPSGTTRMGSDPKTSVVDSDCKVHGVEGLYVAGSSVFPTSGQANPTLMIVSLAVRLADHLRAKLTGAARPKDWMEALQGIERTPETLGDN